MRTLNQLFIHLFLVHAIYVQPLEHKQYLVFQAGKVELFLEKLIENRIKRK